MPQINPVFFSSLLFWLTISFVCLYFILSKTFLPRIASILESRSNIIKKDIEESEKMQLASQNAKDAYEKSLVEVKLKSKDILSNAKIKMSETLATKEAELKTKIEQRMTNSNEEILAAKNNVLANINVTVTELTKNIIETIALYKPEHEEVVLAVNKKLAA